MKKSLSILKMTGFPFLITYLALTGVLHFWQERFIFPAPAIDVGTIQHAYFEQVFLDTSDGERLLAFHHPSEEGEATILVLHGNGDAAVFQREKGEALAAAGFGVLLLEYRGYPGSTGTPTEAGLQIDGITAFDFILQQRKQLIGLYAHSLGSGVAVKIASQRAVFATVLEAPFDSLLSVVRSKMPWLPAGFLLRHKFRSDKLIRDVTSPLLIMHGDQDRTIPIKHGRKLFQFASSNARFDRITGAGHNNLLSFSTHLKAIRFFKEFSPLSQPGK